LSLVSGIGGGVCLNRLRGGLLIIFKSEFSFLFCDNLTVLTTETSSSLAVGFGLYGDEVKINGAEISSSKIKVDCRLKTDKDSEEEFDEVLVVLSFVKSIIEAVEEVEEVTALSEEDMLCILSPVTFNTF